MGSDVDKKLKELLRGPRRFQCLRARPMRGSAGYVVLDEHDEELLVFECGPEAGAEERYKAQSRAVAAIDRLAAAKIGEEGTLYRSERAVPPKTQHQATLPDEEICRLFWGLQGGRQFADELKALVRGIEHASALLPSSVLNQLDRVKNAATAVGLPL